MKNFRNFIFALEFAFKVSGLIPVLGIKSGQILAESFIYSSMLSIFNEMANSFLGKHFSILKILYG